MPPTTVAPTNLPTNHPTTKRPTNSPASSGPTTYPTIGPTRHACTGDSHGCDIDNGICEQIDNGAGYRCSCVPTHHCSDGDCTTADHTCVLTTNSPTANPSMNPTVHPTSSMPSSSPSQSPTTVYARDRYGTFKNTPAHVSFWRAAVSLPLASHCRVLLWMYYATDNYSEAARWVL